MMAVIDASFLIDLERQRAPALAAFDLICAKAERLLVPAQVATEYLSGLSDEVAGLYTLENAFAVVPFGRAQLLEAARVARRCLRAGALPGWADVQVATLAILEQTYVVSANPSHFAGMDVPCWDYRRIPHPPGA